MFCSLASVMLDLSQSSHALRAGMWCESGLSSRVKLGGLWLLLTRVCSWHTRAVHIVEIGVLERPLCGESGPSEEPCLNPQRRAGMSYFETLADFSLFLYKD